MLKSIECMRGVQGSKAVHSHFFGCHNLQFKPRFYFLDTISSGSCGIYFVQKQAERIDVLSGMRTAEDWRDIVLDGGLDPHGKGEGEGHSVRPPLLTSCFLHCHCLFLISGQNTGYMF